MDAQLQVLLDKQAISEVVLRGARAIDRCDLESLRSIFHEDSYDDHGYYTGTGWGYAEWAVGNILAMGRTTRHLVTNHLIEVDGDVAFSEAYIVGLQMVPAGSAGSDEPQLFELHARYVDRFERVDDVWAIRERRLVFDWTASRPLQPTLSPDAPQFRSGGRWPDDPVYRVRETRPGT